MVRVSVRVEASSTTDPYVRFHGVAVDSALPKGFWEMVWPPEWYVTTARSSFTASLDYDLPPGNHFVMYGNSGIAEFPWHAKIYVNDELIAEGDVHRDSFLRADFSVSGGGGITPTPTPAPITIPWWVWAAVGAVGLGVVFLAVRGKR